MPRVTKAMLEHQLQAMREDEGYLLDEIDKLKNSLKDAQEGVSTIHTENLQLSLKLLRVKRQKFFLKLIIFAQTIAIGLLILSHHI